MSVEMPGVPIVGRGDDCACDVACVCWPAQEIRGFKVAHPLASSGHVIAFCNGVWACEDGASEHGCCYIRAVHKGDHAAPGCKAWRVASKKTTEVLRSVGLGVACSSTILGHRRQLWGKCLYLLPLALAVADCGGLTGRTVTNRIEYAEWYGIVRHAAVATCGESEVSRMEPRVKFLISRTPRGWIPSPSPEELQYFRERLCVG